MKTVHLHPVELGRTDGRRLQGAGQYMDLRTKPGQRTRLIPGVGPDPTETGLRRQLMREQGDLHCKARPRLKRRRSFPRSFLRTILTVRIGLSIAASTLKEFFPIVRFTFLTSFGAIIN